MPGRWTQRRIFLADAQTPIQHAHEDDDSPVRIEPRIEDQRAQRGVDGSPRRRHQVDNGLQDVMDPDSLLGAAENGVASVQADDGFDLFADAFGLGGRKIDLVDHAG